MLSKASVKKPLTVVVAIIIIAILGVVSYTNMGVDLLPEMDLPYFVIITVYAGEEPDVIEQEITIPLEDAFSTVSGIEQMNSSSYENYSMIIVQLTSGSDTDAIRSAMEDAIALSTLPSSDMRQDPIIMAIDPSMMPIMNISVGIEGVTNEEANAFYADVITRINAVEGVASVGDTGMVQKYAFLDSDTEKTADFVINALSDKFGISLALTAEQKEELRVELRDIVADAKSNPDLQTNGQIDTTKVLDALLDELENAAPEETPEDNPEEAPEDNPEEAPEDDPSAAAELLVQYLVGELRTEGSVARTTAVNLLQNVLDNSYILEDGEENQKIFNNLVDEFTQSSVQTFLETYLSSTLTKLSEDVYKQVISAQDFEYPAGSVTKGSNTHIVKVGTVISSRQDFMDMPVFTVDVAETLADYLDQIRMVLTLFAVASEDGTVTVTDTQLRSLADSLTLQAETTTEYEEWVIDNITSDSTTSAYYVKDSVKEAWIQQLRDDTGFQTLTADWDTNAPISWRTQILDYVRTNAIFPAVGTQTADSVIFDDNYTAHYLERLQQEIENALQGKPDDGDYEAYADYVVSCVPALSEENRTVWSEYLLADEAFCAAADGIFTSTNAHWQKSILNHVITEKTVPAAWKLSMTLGTSFETYALNALNTAYSQFDLGKPTDATGFAQLGVSGIAQISPYADYYVSSDARAAWSATIAADADFITMISTIGANDDYMLMVYRYMLADAEAFSADETHAIPTLLPYGDIVIAEKYWTDNTGTLFDAQLVTLNTQYTAIETAQENLREQMGEEAYDTMIKFFANRTADENYDMLLNIFDVLGEFGGEGTVVEGINEENVVTYTLDIRKVEQKLESISDDIKITLQLKHLCNITFMDDLSKQITYLTLGITNGDMTTERAVQLSIDKEPTASSAEVTENIKLLLEEIKQENAAFSYTILSDDGLIIDYMLSTVLSSLILGGMLAILILAFFLHDLRATFVISSSILISVMFAFVLMYFSGVSLNAISMGGLALGVGMLVDNSIVVLENTYRLRSKGYSVLQSAVQGARQMTPAVIASTLTTIIVFLPIVFVQGLVKEIMTDMALTVCFSLLASLLVSLTLVPVAYNTFMGGTKKREAKKDKSLMRETRADKALKGTYLKSLNFALHNRALFLIVTIALLGGSVYAALNTGTELFPNSYMGYVTVSVQINSDAIQTKNAGLSYTSDNYYTYDDAEQDVVEELTRVFGEFQDINAVGISRSGGMSVGGFDLGSGGITATLTLIEEEDRSMTASEFVEELQYTLDRTSGDLYSTNVSMYSLSSLISLSSGSMNVYVYGDNYTRMQTETIALQSRFADVEGVTAVDSGVSEGAKEYRIVIDKAKANLYGLTVGQVYLQISDYLKTPAMLHTLTLNGMNADENENLNVYLYSGDYTSKYWYNATDSRGKSMRVFFNNNATDDDTSSRNEYFVRNTGTSSVYTKNMVDGEEVLTFVDAGGYIPATRSGNVIKWFIAHAEEQADGTTPVTYTEYSATVDTSKSFYSNLRADIDLITMQIHSENMLTDTASTKTVQLYELLSDECLLRDEAGNVLYRQSATDARVPVGIQLYTGYTSIAHRGGRKCITMTVYYDDEISSRDMTTAIDAAISDYNQTKPAAISVTTTSTGGVTDGIFESLYLILGIAVLLIFLVMVAQFQSWKSPIIIMGTVLLAFTGSFLLLAATSSKLGIMALIGLILLMGVVVNNGIVFVDYTNSLIEAGVPKRQALLRAGTDRLRPILMTALTTILGMFFMALDGSDYGQLLQPLAITAVGGLSYATLMTLYIIPILYDLINRKTEKKAARAKAFRQADFEAVSSEEGISDMSDDFGERIIRMTEADSANIFAASKRNRIRRREERIQRDRKKLGM